MAEFSGNPQAMRKTASHSPIVDRLLYRLNKDSD